MGSGDSEAPRAAEAVDGDAGRNGGPPRAFRRFARARRWALEIALFAGLYFGLTAFQGRNLLSTHAPAPSFELSTLNGERVSLDSLRGKRAVLHFWATWCGVCAREHGALNAVASGLGKDEALYAIVADSGDAEKVGRYVAEQHIAYPVLLGTSDVVEAFHVASFPTTYYVDREGKIGGRTVGMATRFSIRARIGLLN
jgi:peroxiredoxin